MSAGPTHMLIGGVAGLGLVRWFQVPLVLPQHTSDLIPWGVIVGSALLATLPDIDEPSSWIAQHVRGTIVFTMTMLGLVLGLIVVWQPHLLHMSPLPWMTDVYRWFLPTLVALLGSVLGVIVSAMLLTSIRRLSGGHRRLTHSLVVALVLGGVGWWGWRQHMIWSFVPLCFAYSIVVHDIGDVVTPAGVPLLYPLSARRFGLPLPIARFGEHGIFILAVVLGYALLTS